MRVGKSTPSLADLRRRFVATRKVLGVASARSFTLEGELESALKGAYGGFIDHVLILLGPYKSVCMYYPRTESVLFQLRNCFVNGVTSFEALDCVENTLRFADEVAKLRYCSVSMQWRIHIFYPKGTISNVFVVRFYDTLSPTMAQAETRTFIASFSEFIATAERGTGMRFGIGIQM